MKNLVLISALLFSFNVCAERNTGDEIILECGSWAKYTLKQSVNECNSNHCVSWGPDEITVEKQDYFSMTIISRKDLSFRGASAYTDGVRTGTCEIIENTNIF